MRAMPMLHVKHDIRPSSQSKHVQWPCYTSQALAFMDASPTMLWHRLIHMLTVLCTAGGQLYCTSCIDNDYISKLNRAGECSWSWKCGRWLYYKTAWTVPGAIL